MEELREQVRLLMTYVVNREKADSLRKQAPGAMGARDGTYLKLIAEANEADCRAQVALSRMTSALKTQ